MAFDLEGQIRGQRSNEVKFFSFLPARRYASAGNRDRNVSVCLSVRPSLRSSATAGNVSKRRKLTA